MSANKCKILRFLADNFFTVIVAAVAIVYLVIQMKSSEIQPFIYFQF